LAQERLGLLCCTNEWRFVCSDRTADESSTHSTRCTTFHPHALVATLHQVRPVCITVVWRGHELFSSGHCICFRSAVRSLNTPLHTQSLPSPLSRKNPIAGDPSGLLKSSTLLTPPPSHIFSGLHIDRSERNRPSVRLPHTGRIREVSRVDSCTVEQTCHALPGSVDASLHRRTRLVVV
jgi:hypothetical protein